MAINFAKIVYELLDIKNGHVNVVYKK